MILRSIIYLESQNVLWVENMNRIVFNVARAGRARVTDVGSTNLTNDDLD